MKCAGVQCLTAANGGKPVVSSQLPIPSPAISTISMTGDRSRKEIGAFRGFGGPVAGRTGEWVRVSASYLCASEGDLSSLDVRLTISIRFYFVFLFSRVVQDLSVGYYQQISSISPELPGEICLEFMLVHNFSDIWGWTCFSSPFLNNNSESFEIETIDMGFLYHLVGQVYLLSFWWLKNCSMVNSMVVSERNPSVACRAKAF